MAWNSDIWGSCSFLHFYLSIISSAPARNDTFFHDFIEYGFMKHPSLLRGEDKRTVVIHGE